MNAKAPNCPTQNPIEDIWLQAKTWIRRFCALLPSWAHLTWMFEWFIRNTPFDFASLQMYGVFSKIKYDSYIQPNRVEGLEAGVYYYHPADHRLLLLSAALEINGSFYGGNQPIFE